MKNSLKTHCVCQYFTQPVVPVKSDILWDYMNIIDVILLSIIWKGDLHLAEFDQVVIIAGVDGAIQCGFTHILLYPVNA